MNLTKLFETQRILDARIEKEHPRIEGEDRLAKKILALQVELGELANEQRSWKFWSNDQEPRGKGKLIKRGLNIFDNGKWNQIYPPVFENPLLEEYVDCLHFILSIGLELGWKPSVIDLYLKSDDINNQFTGLFYEVAHFSGHRLKDNYYKLVEVFVGLGEMLGFTWDQVEQAYYDKNAINHTRQDTGY